VSGFESQTARQLTFEDAMDGGRSPLRRGVAVALPFAVAVGLFGVSFGVLADATRDLGAVASIVMSVFTFAGSAQFAAVSVFAAGGQAPAAIAAAILLNLRYLAIGASVAPSMQGGRLRRFLTAQLIVDESWALSSRGTGKFEMPVLVGAGLALWIAWVVGTVLGVVGGRALGDPKAFGLDAAFPALFLALVMPQLRTRRALAAAVLGAAIALVLVPISPPGVPIVAAALAALIALIRR